MKRRTIARALVTALSALAACGEGPGPNPNVEPSADAGSGAADAAQSVPATPGFEAEPEPAGAAVFMTGTLVSADELVVQLWAKDLGPAFGLALHVRHDPAHLQLLESTLASPLGADAASLKSQSAGDLALGAARSGRAAGERAIQGSVSLGTLRFKPLGAGASRLSFASVQVRRADGSFVPAAIAGGTLRTIGGAP